MVPPPAEFTLEQQKALAALKWRSGKQLEVRGNPDNNTVRFLEGKLLEPAAVQPEESYSLAATTALNFLRKNGELLRLRDPEREMIPVREQKDEFGYTQHHFTQNYQGLRVWPASLT